MDLAIVSTAQGDGELIADLTSQRPALRKAQMILAVSFGSGAEIRRPLGISIVGGLLISQLLTL